MSFFFSSRRRHTRFDCDWSSDVCSSDLLTGIGHATARAFAEEGARIVVSGRRDEAGQAFAKELCPLRPGAGYLQAGLRHRGDVRNLADHTVPRLGPLDVALNKAGTEGRT